ncbi:diguanylate cyclase [Hydrogenophaga sp.]|uniref:diguanylate cyclase domain-containing protein n=1 Tax=Hydrogenophaga sp. TaxID=1904254 RepID=UPI0026131A6D|nr:diguanylate cyclase [Hydrogenophaga sp.]MCW5653487.1 GGDEF domain-containing protein [Hydrogenophaga sp.]
MSFPEVAIWSAMLGGVLTLAALALADVLDSRSKSSVRNLLFVFITGASCVVITGLPEQLVPGLPPRVLMVLKAGMGPAAGAMALYYLGSWLGGVREDAMVHRLTAWAAVVLGLAALGLAAAATQVHAEQFRELMLFSAVVNLVPVLLAFVAVMRAARLGDPLAPRMLLALVCLAVMTCGLYLRGLDVQGLGLGAWLLTATATVLYFLMATVLGLLRNRHNRELIRLSRLQQGSDPATGLPTGAALLAQVEHFFWRTAQNDGECTVICLYVSNLYELADSAGAGVESQILVTMAARIRRAAGFRGVVGLYHPRCFVVVLTADRHAPPITETVAKLRHAVSHPMTVMNDRKERQIFRPRLGMGTVSLDPHGAHPMDVLNDAERQALARVLLHGRIAQSELETEPMPLT